MRKLAASTLIGAILWIASPGSAVEHAYTCETHVVLGSAMQAKMDRIAAEFRRRTGRRVHVTSGTRSPREQAVAMYEKLRRGQRLTRLYRDFEAASEIQAAYRRARPRGRGVAVREMTRVIRRQMGRGCFISRHLTANAVDVRSRNLTRRERRVFRDVVRSVGGVRLLEEGTPPHFHLQMD